MFGKNVYGLHGYNIKGKILDSSEIRSGKNTKKLSIRSRIILITRKNCFMEYWNRKMLRFDIKSRFIRFRKIKRK